MEQIAITLGLTLACCIGILLTVFRLPGTWLIIAAAGIYQWLAVDEGGGWIILAILVGLAVIGEVGELLASVITSKKAGASRQAAWGGLIGGFVGMFLFSLPLPVIGTLAGAVIGCFVGALIVEWRVRGKLGQGAKVGVFSAIGFVLGAVFKLAVALMMAGLLITSAVFHFQTGQTDEPTSAAPANTAQPVSPE